MDFDRVLSQLLSDPKRAGLAGAVAGGLLASGGGRKLGKKALELGGMAALAGLAYSAWQRHRQGAAAQSGSLAPTREQLLAAGFLPATATEGEDFGRALFRAMVAAAHADGRLDAGERAALHARIESLGGSDAERAELRREIEHPVGIEELLASARTPAQAAEIYSASLLACGADARAERGYLALLAARLGLEEALVASIERELVSPEPPAPGSPHPHAGAPARSGR
jgi:uncharacterized membrane protein YebE (DUF533 family)